MIQNVELQTISSSIEVIYALKQMNQFHPSENRKLQISVLNMLNDLNHVFEKTKMIKRSGTVLRELI